MDNETRLKIFRKASLCRHFENKVFNLIKQGVFKIPIYLSAGEEFIPSTISTLFENKQPLIFAQHRAHSTYIAFGGNLEELRDELLGKESGCAKGMGGSASIHSPKINMYGHDGMLGSQVPIAVGACHATGKFTICILGDGAAEEDYVLAAMGYAITKSLPILFIIEDNNLCVLTEKKIRRSWSMVNVGKGLDIDSFECDDSPVSIEGVVNKITRYPVLINVNTCRLFWHAGAGIDDMPDRVDRYEIEKSLLSKANYPMITQIDKSCKEKINRLWG